MGTKPKAALAALNAAIGGVVWFAFFWFPVDAARSGCRLPSAPPRRARGRPASR